MDPLEQLPEAPLFEAGSPQVALVGLVLMIGGLALLPIGRYVLGRLVPEREVFFARWGFLDVARVLLLGFVLSLALPAVARSLGADVTAMPVQLALSAAVLLGGSLLVAAISRRADPDGVRSLGVRHGRNGRALLGGIVFYALALPAVLGVGGWWPWVFESLGGEYEPQEIATGLLQQQGATLTWMLVLAVLVVPLLEEVLFRSFLQPLLVQNLGDRGGIVLTSVIFGALHGASAFMPIFALSLLLGAVMLRTRRLVAVWGIHALHNGMMMLMLFNVPESREVFSKGLLGLLIP